MEGGRDGFLGVARKSPPPPPSPFLGSTTSSGGARMLSFSNGAAGAGSELRGQQDAGGSGKGEGAVYSNTVDGTGAPGPDLQALCCECPCTGQLAALHQKKPPSMEYLWLQLLLGWTPFRPGCGDAEPGRCRRTDGKKWRCSRDAVGDQKYCERHLNRGRNRSRKHVEGQKATTTITGSAMTVSGGVSSQSHALAWQQQVKSSANVSDPISRESNRKFPDQQNIQNRSSVSTSVDSLDLSSPQSPQNHHELTLPLLEPQHDHDQAYILHGSGSSSEKGSKLQECRLVSRETIDDGPLGEVFKSKGCQSASADILTDEWTASRKLHSPTGIPRMTMFSSVSSSNTVQVENRVSSNGYLTGRMVNSQIVPTLL
ncbi:hypothetical protein ACP4OV_027281 [Aristida adscensionis]